MEGNRSAFLRSAPKDRELITSVALSTNLLHATVPVREIGTTDFDPASELRNKLGLI